MATPKYKKQYDEMLKNNEDLFSEFRTVQDAYEENSKRNGKEFDEISRKILKTIRKNEDMFCSK